jgi:hypothetical protein
MVLGSLIIPYEKVKEISEKIKGVKLLHGMDAHNELKWTKVSNNKIDLYRDIVKLFLSDNDIRFRCVVVPVKSKLNHDQYFRTHDNFYYVMYYYGLKFVIDNGLKYNIYFDYKDTNQSQELDTLKGFLHRNCDIPISNLKLQSILSYESQLMQLSDLLTGIVSYKNRGLSSSKAKTELVGLIIDSTGQTLTGSSLVRENKFNVFVWTPQKCRGNNA